MASTRRVVVVAEATSDEMRAAVEGLLTGDEEAKGVLKELVRAERSLSTFCRQCKEVCELLSADDSEWQDILVEFLEGVRDVAFLSHTQLGVLLPLLAPRQQLEMLAFSLDPLSYIDSDHLAAVFFRCCLYGVKYLSRSCLVRNRSLLITACRTLGPKWDRAVGLCFAAEIPVSLLNDEDFVLSGLSHVSDGGHSLQWLSCTAARIGRRRDVVQAFVRHQPGILQHTDYADEEEMAVEALHHSVHAVDYLSPHLRRKRSVLETAASCGAAFFRTKTGMTLRADRELVLLAAAAGGANDLAAPLLPTMVDASLHNDPSVLAAVVHSLVRRGSREESVRRILAMQEARRDDFYRELLKNGACLQLLEPPLRARRDLVLLAVKNDPTALAFAEPAVWAKDQGLGDFVLAVLAAGCRDVPAEARREAGEVADPVGFAAALLLENRNAWSDLSSATQEALVECFEHRCCVCLQLPKEIRTCAPARGDNCRNYFCRPCLQRLASRSTNRRSVDCPTCRLPQVSGRHCGARAWDAEKLVERELQYRAAKRRRLAGDESSA